MIGEMYIIIASYNQDYHKENTEIIKAYLAKTKSDRTNKINKILIEHGHNWNDKKQHTWKDNDKKWEILIFRKNNNDELQLKIEIIERTIEWK
ncbi:hypothetical protein [Tortoise microvirus 20]|nr:hypothetical protein [Tortoise microvirus 20]